MVEILHGYTVMIPQTWFVWLIAEFQDVMHTSFEIGLTTLLLLSRVREGKVN